MTTERFDTLSRSMLWLRLQSKIAACWKVTSSGRLIPKAIRRQARSGARISVSSEELKPFAERPVGDQGHEHDRRLGARKKHEAVYMKLYAERMHPNASVMLVEKAIEEVMRMDESLGDVLGRSLRGLTSEQIADSLDMPASAVRERLAQARELIKIRIKDSHR